MKRRNFLQTAGAAALVTTLPAPMLRARTAEEFHIAAILAFSGAYGLIGNDMRKGAELAVAKRGGMVLGKPIRFTWEDDETKPQPAVQKASRLLAEGAQMMFGAVSSASTLALQSLSTQRKVPHLVTISADDAITKRDGAPYSFRTSNTLGMEVNMSMEFVKSRGLKKIDPPAEPAGADRDRLEVSAGGLRGAAAGRVAGRIDRSRPGPANGGAPSSEGDRRALHP